MTAVVQLTAELLNNGTMYAHVYLTRPGYSPDPLSGNYHRYATVLGSCSLVTYYHKKVSKVARNLVSGTEEMVRLVPTARVDSLYVYPQVFDSKGSTVSEKEPYWLTELNIRIVTDWSAFPRGSIPAVLQPSYRSLKP